MRKYIVVAAVAAAALAATPPALAGQATVSLAPCLFGSGERTVAAGDTLLVQIGWADISPRFVEEFIAASDVTASIDGDDLADAEQYFQPVEPQHGERLFGGRIVRHWFVSWWRYELGALAPGETVVVGFDWRVTEPVMLLTEEGRVERVEPFGVVSGTCTITAA